MSSRLRRKICHTSLLFVLLLGTMIPFGPQSAKAALAIIPAKISAGNSYVSALKSDGTVAIWGGDGLCTYVPPPSLNDVVAISAGSYHTMALKSDGTVSVWGDCALPSNLAPDGETDVASIAAGVNISLILKNDGSVQYFGSNTYGEGRTVFDANDGHVVSFGIDGQTNVKAISTGMRNTLALFDDGTVGSYGDSTLGLDTAPAGLTNIVAISAGGYHSLALKADGTVVAWGDDWYGQLSMMPPVLASVVDISAGGRHSLALKADGTVVAWGDDSNGQTDVPFELTQPNARNKVVAISAGNNFSMAQKADGTIVIWGMDNGYGISNVPGADSDLSDLQVQEGVLSPPFSTTVPSYTSYIAPSTPSVHITATLTETAYTAVYIDNNKVTNGSPVEVILNGASQDIPIVVSRKFHPDKSYTIHVSRDTTVPDVLFDTNGNASASKTAASVVTATDSESGVASLQYAWTQNTSVPIAGWTPFTSGATLTQASGEGYWYLHVKATDQVGNVTDAVSNGFVLDNRKPTVALSTTASDSIHGPFPVTIAFNEAVSGFDSSDITVVNGTAVNFNTVNASTYSVTINPITIGQDVSVDVSADKANDAAANGNTASNTLQIQYTESSYVPTNVTTPSVQISPNGNMSSAKTAASVVNVTNAGNGATLQYVWTQGTDVLSDNWSDFVSGDTVTQVSGDGKWYLHVRVTDTSGNVTDAVSNAFVLGNQRLGIQVPNGVWSKKVNSCSNSTSTGAADTLSFTDIQKHWAQPFIQLAESKGFVVGVGDHLFIPDQSVTRAELIAMLVRAIGPCEVVDNKAPYDDVQPGSWYFDIIVKAKKLGILDFVSGASFKPNQILKREEMASVMTSILAKEQLPPERDNYGLNRFEDVGSVDSAYLENVRFIVNYNIMIGMSENTFSPKSDTTRAQATVVLIRILSVLGIIN